jgi:2-polyprenyl-3-methyl-5-hydroxy-6-metoxy-1,4-benzoquinol methylase
MIREKIILESIRGKDVLDIGSVGQTASYSLWNLYKTVKCKSLTGIDLPDSKETALSNFDIKESDLNIDSRIVYGNMETYKFDKRFDVIVAGDVLEHIYNQQLFLSNIREHLKEKGKLIITTPNARWITVFSGTNPTHTLWHDKVTLERILNVCGYKIDFFRYYFGNKKSYNLILKILAYKQGMLVICSKK